MDNNSKAWLRELQEHIEKIKEYMDSYHEGGLTPEQDKKAFDDAYFSVEEALMLIMLITGREVISKKDE